MTVPPPVVERVGPLLVVRDDHVEGGTKRRFLGPLLARWPEAEFVYAGPAEGYGQVALAWAARDAGKRARVFVAGRARRHRLTEEAARAGAAVSECRPGYLTVVSSRARTYCAESGARALPLGFDTAEVAAEAARQLAPVVALAPSPPEVWCIAGSGLLTRVLQGLWPEARHFAIRIGREPDAGGATVVRAPEPFARAAAHPPPFPSCATYDAKAWRFLSGRATPGALFWNVAA